MDKHTRRASDICELKYLITKVRDFQLQEKLCVCLDLVVEAITKESHELWKNKYDTLAESSNNLKKQLSRVKVVVAKQRDDYDKLKCEYDRLSQEYKVLDREYNWMHERSREESSFKKLLEERKKNALLSYQVETLTREKLESSATKKEQPNTKRSRLFDW